MNMYYINRNSDKLEFACIVAETEEKAVIEYAKTHDISSGVTIVLHVENVDLPANNQNVKYVNYLKKLTKRGIWNEREMQRC